MRRGAFGRYALGSLALVAATALGSSLTVAVTSGASRSPAQRPASRHPIRARASTRPKASAGTAGTLAVGFLAQSVSFVSDDVGFVLGAVQCATGWCPAVRRTPDRGAAWTSVSSPPAAIDSTRPGSIDTLRFANLDDGFAFGPGLWETQDAGATWMQVDLPGRVAALGVSVRAAYAVVAVDCDGLATCTAPAVLFESALGSGTWHTVPEVTLTGTNFYGSDISVAGDAVYVAAGNTFVGSTTGQAFRAVTNPCPPPPGPLTTPPSRDGVTAVAASDPSDLAVLCGEGVAMGSQRKLVYVSGNGGASYRELAVPPFGGDNRAIAASAPTTVFVTATSGASEVYRTTGADTSWTTPVAFADAGLGIRDLSFVSRADGALIHGTGVAQQAETYVSERKPTRIAGRVAALYLTDDGGTTWSRTPIPT